MTAEKTEPALLESTTLDEVAAEADQAARDQHRAATVVRRISRARGRGTTWSHITKRGTVGEALGLFGSSWQKIRSSASRVRRIAGRGLAEEGLATRQIGKLFGVSHQRVSAILSKEEKS